MESCFALVGARQHYVAKICNASQRANAHKLQFMCVDPLAGVTYLRYTVLMSSNKSETAVHCCDPALLVLVMLVSRNVFHVVSALQSFAFRHFILADQISCRSYVCSVYRMRSLAVSYSIEKRLVYVTLMTIPHWLRYARAPTNCHGPPHTSRQGPTRRFLRSSTVRHRPTSPDFVANLSEFTAD